MAKYYVDIGLEVHARLKTNAKLFSASASNYGANPNSLASLVDLAMPGTLPVVNAAAIKQAIKFGIAINADIANQSTFARKHYFYPDLAKGYQISQHKNPIITGGKLQVEVAGEIVEIALDHAHLEEDAGKLSHYTKKNVSLVDYNRAGTPLLEIVSQPDMHSAAEAVAYLKKLHYILRYYDISDGNMEQGSFRCDVNISLRKNIDAPLGIKVEIKNLNSFRFIEAAINCEIKRQTALLDAEEKIICATMLYDPNENVTAMMRSKESAADYRYFDDPDLPVIHVSSEIIQEVQQSMPIRIEEQLNKLTSTNGLSEKTSHELLQKIEWLATFNIASEQKPEQAKLIANWILQDIPHLKQEFPNIEQKITAQHLSDLAMAIAAAEISKSAAKAVLHTCCSEKMDIKAAIAHLDIGQICDPKAITAIIDATLQQHPEQCAAYRNGETKLLTFFLGKVMQQSKGKANPKLTREILEKKLNP